jgi:hypothetical protein
VKQSIKNKDSRDVVADKFFVTILTIQRKDCLCFIDREYSHFQNLCISKYYVVCYEVIYVYNPKKELPLLEHLHCYEIVTLLGFNELKRMDAH